MTFEREWLGRDADQPAVIREIDACDVPANAADTDRMPNLNRRCDQADFDCDDSRLELRLRMPDGAIETIGLGG